MFEIIKINGFWVSNRQYASQHDAEAAALARSLEFGEIYGIREINGNLLAIFAGGVKFVPESAR